MAQMYKVVRVIAGIDGKSIMAGTTVDASQWRNLKALIAAGRLVPVKDESPAAIADEKPAKKAATKKAAAKPVETDEDKVTDDVDL